MDLPGDPTLESGTHGARLITSRPLGVAAFVGVAGAGPLGRAVLVEDYAAFARRFGAASTATGYLAAAVRGFFANGGCRCWVVRAADTTAGAQIVALRIAEQLEEPSVIVAPDAHLAEGDGPAAVQRQLIAACSAVTGCTAIIDPPPGLGVAEVLRWREVAAWNSTSAATYYPWLTASAEARRNVPPSGHVAGVLARVDVQDGVQRAPTGVALTGVAVSGVLPAGAQQRLNRAGINCLRAWPGPEPRIWGARTLSLDPDARYLHHERTTEHLAASIAQSMRWIGGSTDVVRRARDVDHAVTAYLAEAWTTGVLAGHTPAQAFAVSCEPGHHDDLILELRLAVAGAGHGRQLRIIHRSRAVTRDDAVSSNVP